MPTLFKVIGNWKLESRNSVVKRQNGFTLIELLVVIGILGILAAALVATIDPFEQLKKATDANVKNILVEFLDATTRYYTTHTAYPWDSTGNGGGGCMSAAPSEMQLSGTDGINCLESLQNDNELKKAFTSDVGDLAHIYITYDSSDQAVIGCFMPGSKSQQKDGNTIYDANGSSDGTKDCGSTSLTNGCFWCTR